MPNSNVVGAPQIIGWVITAVAFGGNMLWNYLNRVHTNELAAGIRKDQYAREVWGRLRARVETKLDDFVAQVIQLPGQIATMQPAPDLSAFLDVMGHGVVALHDGLATALTDLDSSAFCFGDDWANAAFGETIGLETSWDLMLVELGAATAASDVAASLIHLKAMGPLVRQIEAAVRDLIRKQDWQHEPK